MPVLGLAGGHGRKWKRLSRYVDWASPIHITVHQMRLRWMDPIWSTLHPPAEIQIAHGSWIQGMKTKLRLAPQAKNQVQVRSFTSIQMVHTHTHAAARLFRAPTNEMTMKMTWKMKMRWRWKLPNHGLTGTRRRGTQEEEGKEQSTNTNTPSPKRAKPRKGKEKEKSERPTDHGTRRAEEGEDGSAWHQPNKAKA